MVKNKKWGSNAVRNTVVIFGILTFFIGLVTIPFVGQVYPNIYIAGQYVGDKSKDQAVDEIKKIRIPEVINLNFKDETKKLSTQELITNISYEKSIERAYNLTNSGNLILDTYNKLKLIYKPVNLGLLVEFEDQKISEALLILSSKVGQKPVQPSAKINNNLIEINPGKNGVEIDINKVSSDFKQNIYFARNTTIEVPLVETKSELNSEELEKYKQATQKIVGKKLEIKNDFDIIYINQNTLLSFVLPKGDFDRKNIEKEIANIARKVNRNPQDSVFIIENGVVREFTPSKEGITVDEDKLTNEIEKYTEKLINNDNTTYSFDLPVVTSAPKIKTEDVNNLGINTLLGKGVSYYKGSIPNRIHNITLAQSKFKGILVPSGEIFSFNSILGDVSSYTGFKAAYVIKDGKTVLGDGGGICQVSTTLFRAALSAGLPIIERRAHSYRVGYYEQGFAPGLDATVFYPTTDFKFKNDTPAYILIQPIIDKENYNLNFEIYGTDDGRIATTTKPIITSSSAPAADLYVDDPSLPPGVTKQIEYRAYGARVVFDYKVTRNNETLIDQKFVSSYRPWQAVYLKGTSQ